LITLTHPKSIAAEQFRKLKTTILESAEANGGGRKCILITSAAIGEGKSLTATNLAISLAQEIQNHVLLVDADLRRPSVHKYFGIGKSRGLSDYLSNEVELSQLLVKTDVPKLSILPAGTIANNAAELFSSHKMKNFLAEVKARYADRYIVIDSTPVMPTSEPDILSRQVDGILFVVRSGQTPREVIQRSIQRLDKEKLLGIVFNSIDLKGTGYHYGYYRYYSYYGDDKE
jgi:protein-tyrosine kinase